MFSDFDDSYRLLPQVLPTHKVLSRTQVNADPTLSSSVAKVDSLCRNVFSQWLPRINVIWGVEDDPNKNACVYPSLDPPAILLTRGACSSLHNLGDFVRTNAWIKADPSVAPFQLAVSVLPESTLGEMTHLLGLVALLGHEVGHLIDMCATEPSDGLKPAAQLGQEISADGRGVEIGLGVVRAWARDHAAGDHFMEHQITRLGALLLVMGNAEIDEIDLDKNWNTSDSHPVAAQRLVGTCLKVGLHFREPEDRGFGTLVLKAALSGLKAFGSYSGPVNDLAIKQLVKNYDRNLVRKQRAALRSVLIQRRVTALKAGPRSTVARLWLWLTGTKGRG